SCRREFDLLRRQAADDRQPRRRRRSRTALEARYRRCRITRLASGPREDLRVRLIADLERALAQRDAAGLRRVRRTVHSPAGAHVDVDGQRRVSFASNDYLGLANHPRIVAAAVAAAHRWGVGAAASHLISGHSAAHAALEAELADW